MDLSIKLGPAGKQKSACLIVAVFSGKNLSDSAKSVDKSSRGSITGLLKRGDLSGKTGESLLIPTISNVAADRVLVIGAGKESGIDPKEFIRLTQKAAQHCVDSGYRNAMSALTEIAVKDRDVAWKIRQQAMAFSASSVWILSISSAWACSVMTSMSSRCAASWNRSIRTIWIRLTGM